MAFAVVKPGLRIKCTEKSLETKLMKCFPAIRRYLVAQAYYIAVKKQSLITKAKHFYSALENGRKAFKGIPTFLHGDKLFPHGKRKGKRLKSLSESEAVNKEDLYKINEDFKQNNRSPKQS